MREEIPSRRKNKSSRSRRIPFVRPLLGAALFFFGGCAVETYAPDVAPEYVIIRDFTAFYRLGPEQGRGADASLRPQTRVKLLRREMGFSLVQLEDLRTGYVANENMAVASPRAASPADVRPEAGSRRRGSPKGRGTAYSGPQVNDTPLPNPAAPPPDLNIAPEVVPETIPAPSEVPSPSPKFRY